MTNTYREEKDKSRKDMSKYKELCKNPPPLKLATYGSRTLTITTTIV